MTFGKRELTVENTQSESFNLLLQYLRGIGFNLTAFDYQGKNIAVVFLKDVFDQEVDKSGYVSNILQGTFDAIHPEQKLEIVVVSFNNRTVGFVVDKLLQQKEIVEKPLMRPVDRVKFISGFTILGSGNVCLVLNVPHILQFIFNLTASSRSSKNFTLN